MEKDITLTTDIDLSFPSALEHTIHRENVEDSGDVEGGPMANATASVVADVKAHLDRAKVAQVIHNLVSNGLKFTPAGGRVSVKVTLEDGHQSSIRNVYAPTVGDRTTDPPMVVKISVTDTGVGLSQVNNLEVRCLQHLGSVWVHEQFHDDFLNYSRVTLYLWRYLTLT